MSSYPDHINSSAVIAYLQFLRKGRGMSQDDLAERVGVPRTEIERFERAGGEVAGETLSKIIEALGAADQHVRYLLAAQPDSRDEHARMIREGIDMAKAWLQGRDILGSAG